MSILASTKSGAHGGVVVSTGRSKYTIVATFKNNGCQYYVGAKQESWGTGYYVLAYDAREKKYYRHSN